MVKSAKTERAYMIALMCLFALPFALLIFTVYYGTRLRDGVVVLTETGCQVLAYHGARVEYLDNGGLCAIRAPSLFGSRATTGRILIQTENGEFEVQLLRREVLSTTY